MFLLYNYCGDSFTAGDILQISNLIISLKLQNNMKLYQVGNPDQKLMNLESSKPQVFFFSTNLEQLQT